MMSCMSDQVLLISLGSKVNQDDLRGQYLGMSSSILFSTILKGLTVSKPYRSGITRLQS